MSVKLGGLCTGFPDGVVQIVLPLHGPSLYAVTLGQIPVPPFSTF